MTPSHYSHDYRTCMQDAAQAYLLRHRAEYLTDSDQLFESGVRHLIVALEVPASLATRLVHLAWSELQDDEYSPSLFDIIDFAPRHSL
ncbi:hypothetical protein D3C87_1342800 [compost metagenome]